MPNDLAAAAQACALQLQAQQALARALGRGLGQLPLSLGQAIVAVVKPLREANFSAGGLIAHCKQHLPNFMVPLQVVSRNRNLPRNPNGKIDRKALVEELRGLFSEG